MSGGMHAKGSHILYHRLSCPALITQTRALNARRSLGCATTYQPEWENKPEFCFHSPGDDNCTVSTRGLTVYPRQISPSVCTRSWFIPLVPLCVPKRMRAYAHAEEKVWCKMTADGCSVAVSQSRGQNSHKGNTSNQSGEMSLWLSSPFALIGWKHN